MPTTKREYFERRRSALDTERSSFISHWRELSDFVEPRRGRFDTTDRNKGTRRHQSIINSQATQALEAATAGMLAGIMSPSRPWFKLRTPDRALMEHAPVKIWLSDTEELMYDIFNASNLYNMAPVMITELLLFGTGAMLHVDDFEDVARFYTLTAGSYMISQNDRYEVDTLVREFEMTVEQMAERFGVDSLSRTVRNEWDRGNYDSWYPVVHFIEPNPEFNPNRLESRFKLWRSVYYEKTNERGDTFLEESGFDEFPAYVPRWKVTGEDIYGTNCPGMTALGDIKGLQIEEKRKAQAIDKMVNPPLTGPPTVRNVPVSSLPGGLTIYAADAGSNKLEPLYRVEPRLQELMLDIQKTEGRINNAFFTDLFLAITNMQGIQPRNELELTQRNQERLLQLGPVLERLQNEFLGELVERTFNQIVRAGIIPVPPEELHQVDLEIEFVSALAIAQKAVASATITNMVAFAANLAGSGFTDSLDKVDADQAIDEMANIIGAPPRIIRPDDQVAEIRQQRQAAIQAQQAMAMGEQGAGIMKTLSDAKPRGDDESVLSGVSDAVVAAAS